jgi:hypothetical protein
MKELRFMFKLMAVAVAVMAVGLLGKGSLTDSEAHTFNKNYSVKLDAGGPLTAGSPVDTTTILNIPDAGDPFFSSAVTSFSGIDSTPGAPVPLGHQVGEGDFLIQTNGGAMAANGQPAPCAAPAPAVGSPYVIYSSLTSTDAAIRAVTNGAAAPGWDASLLGSFGTFLPAPYDTAWVEDWSIPATGSPLAESVKADGGFGGLPKAVNRAPVYLPVVDSFIGVPHVSRGFGVAVIVPTLSETGVDFLTFELGAFNVTLAVVGQGSVLGLYPSIPSGAQVVVTCPPFSSSTLTMGVSVPLGPNAGQPATTIQEITGAGAQFYRISVGSASDYTGDGVADFRDLCKAHVGSTDAGNGIGTQCNTQAAWQAYEALPWVPPGGLDLPPAGYGAPLDNAEANAALMCVGAPIAGQWGTATTNPQQAVTGGPPWAPCQDADGDGWLNAADNCPLHNDQLATNNAGDSVGNACDPGAFLSPLLKGDGRGWGYPASPLAAPFAEGYHHHTDLCIRNWAVGDGSDANPVAGACVLFLMGNVLSFPFFNDNAKTVNTAPDSLRDAARNGEPDWIPGNFTALVPGAHTWPPQSCAQTDADGDGLTDCVESHLAWVAGAAAHANAFPLDSLSPIDAGAYLAARPDNSDAILAANGGTGTAVSSGHAYYACASGASTTRSVTRSDVGRSGTVVVGDVVTAVNNFGASASDGLAAARSDIGCSGTVVVGDVVTAVNNFGKSAPGN